MATQDQLKRIGGIKLAYDTKNTGDLIRLLNGYDLLNIYLTLLELPAGGGNGITQITRVGLINLASSGGLNFSTLYQVTDALGGTANMIV